MTPDLDSYDRIIVSYSGGKDSLACALLIRGMVGRSKLTLWHQLVDGRKVDTSGLMDWPITEGYVRTTARVLGLAYYLQWKDGGFEREMLREDAYTAGTYFEEQNTGHTMRARSGLRKKSTRLKFPQVAANLRVRWCTAYLKIDVACRAITNDSAFDRGKFLFVTGERRQESAARSKYKEFESHRTCNQKRHVDWWRPVIDWPEEQVWEIIARNRVNPHPAYQLGWGRVSCMACIFGNDDQWASIRDLDPGRFNRIAAYEKRFGLTIHRTKSVRERADAGRSYVTDAPSELRRLAMGYTYPRELVLVDEWKMPAGAFRQDGGPT